MTDDNKYNEESEIASKASDRRGLASASEETRKRVASMGGKAAHASGNAHEFDSDEARQAGRKGGEIVSRNREHMAAIGRKGGANSHGGRGQM